MLSKLKNKIRFYFWWFFVATKQDKMMRDLFVYGTSIEKNGKRINPKNYFL